MRNRAESDHRYNTSAKGRARQSVYRGSEHGRKQRAEYDASLAGAISHSRRQRRYETALLLARRDVV